MWVVLTPAKRFALFLRGHQLLQLLLLELLQHRVAFLPRHACDSCVGVEELLALRNRLVVNAYARFTHALRNGALLTPHPRQCSQQLRRVPLIALLLLPVQALSVNVNVRPLRRLPRQFVLKLHATGQ